MESQISKLIVAATGADGYLPGHRSRRVKQYVSALHSQSIEELVDELLIAAPLVRQARITREVRENNVFPS